MAALASVQLPATTGANSPSSLREQAQALRAQNGSLSTQERAAWLSMATVDTRLEQTQAALVRLRARTRAIAQQRAEAAVGLRIARSSLAASQVRLAQRLRVLYEQGETDSLTVLLGAKSIDEAITALESFQRLAGQDRRFVEEARAAGNTLAGLTRRLATREAEARETEEATAATVATLTAARRERAAMLAGLSARRSSNSAAISSLESQARSLAAAQPPLPAPVAGDRKLSVTATGYSLTGRTSTGVPVGYGIVAVDPNVIPLGTRMTIPGYGEGVAADIGGAVAGARIDVWFPTEAEALAWGTRAVTITLH